MRLESRLERVREELKRKARIELLKGLGGFTIGAATAVSSVWLKPPVSYIAAAVLYTLGYVGLTMATRGGRLQGILSYTGGFILSWFTLYAAFIG